MSLKDLFQPQYPARLCHCFDAGSAKGVTSVDVDVEGVSTPVNVYGSPAGLQSQRKGIRHINKSHRPFAFGEHESSGKLNTTFSA